MCGDCALIHFGIVPYCGGVSCYHSKTSISFSPTAYLPIAKEPVIVSEVVMGKSVAKKSAGGDWKTKRGKVELEKASLDLLPHGEQEFNPEIFRDEEGDGIFCFHRDLNFTLTGTACRQSGVLLALEVLISNLCENRKSYHLPLL